MYFIHSYVSFYVDNTLGNLYDCSHCRDEEIVAVEIWSVPGCTASREKHTHTHTHKSIFSDYHSTWAKHLLINTKTNLYQKHTHNMKNSRLHTQHDRRILICLVISSFSPLHTGMVGRFTCSAQPEAVIAIFYGN